jgi:hypothetical protein
MLELGQPYAGLRTVQALVESESLPVVVDLRPDLSGSISAFVE